MVGAMRTSPRLAASVIAVLLALASPAAAATVDIATTADPNLAAYAAAAQQHWGNPSCATVQVRSMTQPDPAVYARADDCTIWIDASDWHMLDRSLRCNMMLHEWGHLMGHDHTDDPRSIMVPLPINARPAACDTFVLAEMRDVALEVLAGALGRPASRLGTCVRTSTERLTCRRKWKTRRTTLTTHVVVRFGRAASARVRIVKRNCTVRPRWRCVDERFDRADTALRALVGYARSGMVR